MPGAVGVCVHGDRVRSYAARINVQGCHRVCETLAGSFCKDNGLDVSSVLCAAGKVVEYDRAGRCHGWRWRRSRCSEGTSAVPIGSWCIFGLAGAIGFRVGGRAVDEIDVKVAGIQIKIADGHTDWSTLELKWARTVTFSVGDIDVAYLIAVIVEDVDA